MVFGTTKSVADRKPQMTSSTSPTFSTLGRSPSIGPPAYTTDDLLAAKYQKFSRWVHLVRVAIAAVTFIVSIAVIACVGASLRAYSSSRLEPEWILPLWPLNVDLRPSHAILGCGIAVAVLSLAYLAVAFVPMVCHTVVTTVVQHTDHHRACSDEDSTTRTWSPPSSLSCASALPYLPLSSPRSSPTTWPTTHIRGHSVHGRADGMALMTWPLQTSQRSVTTEWRLWIWSWSSFLLRYWLWELRPGVGGWS